MKRLTLLSASIGLMLGSASPPGSTARSDPAKPAAAAHAQTAPAAGARAVPVVETAGAFSAETAPPTAAAEPVGQLTPRAEAPAAPAAAPGRERAGGEGEVRILVSIPAQRAWVFRGDDLVTTTPVSTGRRGHETPTGTFPITQKKVEHYSNRYNNAPMPYMQRLTDYGIALHGGRVPGYPASHGCIRLPHAVARRVYNMTQRGTRVTITRARPRSAQQALALTT
ncbi:MAG TPA: L,D-transpeptidase family protein [Allosphingosinicella sp.]|jgi:lipoprotein-anchoring transpeptidase ErfK/SrfK